MAIGLLAIVKTAVALDNGFGRTPVMGYNSYNDVGCSPNENQIRSAINSMDSRGLRAAGYNFFQIDCGWQGYDRLPNGSITYDSSVFPNGIKPLSDLAISKGFQWSMYTDQGLKSCDTKSTPLRPGSLHYERQDAAMFKAWNTAYMKVDNCYIDGVNNAPKDPRSDFPSRYGTMTSALQNVGIEGVLICQWGMPYQNNTAGLQGPDQWTPPVATSFRVSDDIAQGWANVMRIYNQNIHVNLRGLNGPGHFADMDLLEVGNPGMSLDEQKSHFGSWAMFKSALFVSTNVPQMSANTLSILTNKDLISINQDSLGVPVTLVQRYTNDYDVFAGPLSNGDVAVLLVDQSNMARTLSLNLLDVQVFSANIKDLWTGRTTTNAQSYSAPVGAHGSLALRLSSTRRAPAPKPSLRQYEAEAATLTGGANVQSCSSCSGGKKIGFINDGASATFNKIRTSQETSSVRFDYIDCEIGYLSDQGFNVRGASISVNGGQGQSVLFPLTGYNWDADVAKNFMVKLTGFKTDADNTITIRSLSGSTTFAPDFDKIAVVA